MAAERPSDEGEKSGPPPAPTNPEPPRRQQRRPSPGNRRSLRGTNSKSNTSKLGAAGAGASGGTLLVLVANNLPPGHSLKPWLLGLAPTVTVCLSWLTSWVKDLLDNWRDERELTALIKQAKDILTVAVNDPLTSSEQRERFRQDLETLERIAADRRLARAWAISQRQAGK